MSTTTTTAPALTAAQVQQFRTQGYTTAETLFTSREVAAMQAELARLRADGVFRNVSTDGDGKTHSREKENLQICPLYRKSSFFRALPFQPKVIAAIEALLGSPILLHLDQVFLKPARHGSGTNWHQDNAYFGLEDPMKGTAMWIAVHEATIANGTIEVIPGVAYEKFEHKRDPMSDHHIRCYPDESKAVPCVLPAGGVAFFAYGTPHCTRANNTDRDRAGLAYHFMLEECYTPAQVQRNKGIGTILSGPRATGGEKEYAVRVAGTWEAEVERALASEAAAAAAR